MIACENDYGTCLFAFFRGIFHKQGAFADKSHERSKPLCNPALSTAASLALCQGGPGFIRPMPKLTRAPIIHKSSVHGIKQVSLKEHHRGYVSNGTCPEPLPRISRPPVFPFEYRVDQLSAGSRPMITGAPDSVRNQPALATKSGNVHPDWYYKALHPSWTASAGFSQRQAEKDLIDFGSFNRAIGQPTPHLSGG